MWAYVERWTQVGRYMDRYEEMEEVVERMVRWEDEDMRWSNEEMWEVERGGQNGEVVKEASEVVRRGRRAKDLIGVAGRMSQGRLPKEN